VVQSPLITTQARASKQDGLVLKRSRALTHTDGEFSTRVQRDWNVP